MDAALLRSRRNRMIIQPVAAKRRRLNAGLAGRQLQPLRQLRLAHREKSLAPHGIQPARAAQMLGHVPLVDEIEQGRLQQQWRHMAGNIDRLRNAGHQTRRKHHEANAQCRKQQLRKSADINHPARRIAALHRRNGLPLEAILAVVVVLDDPCVATLGDFQQAQPLLHAHGGAKRVMAGWRHANDTRGRTGPAIQRPAAAIHMQRRQPGTCDFKGRLRAKIARLLHPHRVAGIQQQARQQIESALRAADDDNLLRATAHAPRSVEVRRDRLAQWGKTQRVISAKQGIPTAGAAPGEQTAPGRERNLLRIRHARVERWLPGGAEVKRLAHHHLAAPLDRWPKRIRPLILVPHGPSFQVDNDRAGGMAIVQVTLGNQLLIGGPHGVAPNRQLFGQWWGGRRGAARRQNPPGNQPAQLLIELPLERRLERRIQHDSVERVDFLQIWPLQNVHYWPLLWGQLLHKLVWRSRPVPSLSLKSHLSTNRPGSVMNEDHQMTSARTRTPRRCLALAALALAALAAPVALAQGKKETIYFVGIASPADPFHGVIARGAEQAGKDLGVHVVYIFPDKVTLTDYNAKIEQAIAAQPQGIVILGIDEKGSRPLAQRARELGIRLGFNPAPPVKDKPLRTPDDLYVSRVGSDEYSAGRAAAERLLTEKVKGKVVCGIQIPGDLTLSTRCQGVSERLKEAGIKTAIIEIANEPGQAAELLATYLRAHPDTGAVITLGGPPNAGAREARKAAKRRDLLLGGFDMDAATLQSIVDKDMLFTVDQQPFWRGYIPVLGITHHLRYGLQQANYFLSGPSIVDAANARAALKLSRDGVR